VIYPKERLEAILAGDDPPALRAEAALRLAERYRSEGAGELAILAARFAVLWAPSSVSAWRLLADLHEERREYLRAVLALGELAELLSGDEALGARSRADRLRRLLPSPEGAIADLVRRVEAHAKKGGFAVGCEIEDRRFVPSFENGRAGYIECVWIDDAGPALWRPTERDRRTHLWNVGRHTLLPIDTPWEGPTTALWFLTQAPVDFAALLKSATPWSVATKLEKLERLEELERAIVRALDDPETRTQVCRLTP